MYLILALEEFIESYLLIIKKDNTSIEGVVLFLIAFFGANLHILLLKSKKRSFYKKEAIPRHFKRIITDTFLRLLSLTFIKYFSGFLFYYCSLFCSELKGFGCSLREYITSRGEGISIPFLYRCSFTSLRMIRAPNH